MQVMCARPVAPVQYGYVVSDIEAAMQTWQRHAALGPFFLLENITLSGADYRGSPCDITMTAALAQKGGVQIELIAQHSAAPSVFTEGADGTSCRLHHVGLVVEDAPGYLAQLEMLGHVQALRAVAAGGLPFSYVDTRSALGHMTEVSPAWPAIVDLYEMVRDAAENWDGTDPIRRL